MNQQLDEALRIIEGSGAIEKLKVVQCRAYCEHFGLVVRGDKATLVPRIREHLQYKKNPTPRPFPSPSLFSIRCNDNDLCVDDLVLFDQRVSRGLRRIFARVDSISAQRTRFVFEVLACEGDDRLEFMSSLTLRGAAVRDLQILRQKRPDGSKKTEQLTTNVESQTREQTSSKRRRSASESAESDAPPLRRQALNSGAAPLGDTRADENCQGSSEDGYEAPVFTFGSAAKFAKKKSRVKPRKTSAEAGTRLPLKRRPETEKEPPVTMNEKKTELFHELRRTRELDQLRAEEVAKKQRTEWSRDISEAQANGSRIAANDLEAKDRTRKTNIPQETANERILPGPPRPASSAKQSRGSVELKPRQGHSQRFDSALDDPQIGRREREELQAKKEVAKEAIPEKAAQYTESESESDSESESESESDHRREELSQVKIIPRVAQLETELSMVKAELAAMKQAQAHAKVPPPPKKKGKKPKKPKKPKTTECRGCGKIGHLVRDCRRARKQPHSQAGSRRG